MSEIKLPAERRNSFGKGAARKIRRDHKIPAVLYGHGTDPVHITLPAHDTALALKHANALLSIELEGKSQLALAKDIQRDPIRPIIEHIDLVIVLKGEKVNVDVPVHIEGEAGPDTIVNVESNTIEFACRGHAHPRVGVVSVEDPPAGTQIGWLASSCSPKARPSSPTRTPSSSTSPACRRRSPTPTPRLSRRLPLPPPPTPRSSPPRHGRC